MICRARIRKRRRQNYFAKTTLKERKRPKNTIDKGKWDRIPPKARRGIFISDKLKVVKRYNELVEQKNQAMQISCRKRPKGLTAKQKKDFEKEKDDARKVLKDNVLKKCKEEFPQIVGNCQVWKWAKQAEREKWDDLPEADKTRRLEVPNAWRKKMSLSMKGKILGGIVPLEIQYELDKIVAAHVVGESEITERKEVVSWNEIDTWITIKRMCADGQGVC